MTRRSSPAAEPEEILADLLGLDTGLGREVYYGERAIFYNPGGVAPLGVLVASVKDRDGPRDTSAELSRNDVHRLSFCVTPETFRRRFGAPPARPPKGGVVDLAGYDPTRLDTLMPHPVYGWMRWLQILSPTAASLDELRPLIGESLELARTKWRAREA
jgi:hypothetical protein